MDLGPVARRDSHYFKGLADEVTIEIG
jgi:hypothetical protein